MSIVTNQDGTVTLTADDDPTNFAVLPADISLSERDQAIDAFFNATPGIWDKIKGLFV